jgi:hypothetical protein
MSSDKPSILTQAEQVVAANPEGFQGGVIVDGKDLGAEVRAKLDPGQTGGWTFGMVARVVKGKDRFAALLANWTWK